MKDLTKLTTEEANKIEMVLMMLCQSFREQIECEERLSKHEDLPKKTRDIFASNCEWSKEAYKLIYEEEYQQ